jgi:ketosteroid isomerase-like protein
MSRPSHLSPDDVERAFYAAIEAGDLEAMMATWADDDEIVCIHPNGQRLNGHAAIRESWRAIFGSGKRLRVALSRSVRWQGAMLASHTLVQTLSIDGEPADVAIAATNVFVRGADGWRLLVHHASPLSADSEGANEAAVPKVLH